MSSEFKVNEHGVTSDGYHVLPKRSMASMYIGSSIALLIIAIIVSTIYVYAFPLYAESGIYAILMFVPFVLMAIYFIFGPAVYYARYRYRINEDRIDIRRGIFIISHTVVPVERIHQLEVARGPINNLLNLADVTITTAGGIAKIQFLDLQVAEKTADNLNDYITEILRKRE
ncbi:MAG TPA: PH domain-containing protein [Candidatus Methanomethylophilaceae archaeon]|nr:PH domain-containing protein [Candidatus Methanomethylophilaceae archaeon]